MSCLLLKRTPGLCIFCLSFSIAVIAQQNISENTYRWSAKQTQQNVPVNRFKLLEGHWTGEGLGGQCDEYWSPMKDSLMIGLFRFIENEKTVFTEFMYLMHDSSGWLLRVKHFNPDFTGWEEKNKSVNFRLVRTDENRLLFNGLTFEAPDENTLRIYLAMKNNEGNYREERFVLKKVK